MTFLLTYILPLLIVAGAGALLVRSIYRRHSLGTLQSTKWKNTSRAYRWDRRAK